MRHQKSTKEVEPGLVPGAVFKTVEPYVKHAVGGFDSHALPPFFSVVCDATIKGTRPSDFSGLHVYPKLDGNLDLHRNVRKF